MNKTLLTILTALMLLFGAVGVVAASAGEKATIDPLNSSQQLAQAQPVAQTQAQIQSMDQVQLRLDTAVETGTCSGTQAQDRIRLETKDMLQDQTHLRDQDQVQQSQNAATLNQGNGSGLRNDMMQNSERRQQSGKH